MACCALCGLTYFGNFVDRQCKPLSKIAAKGEYVPYAATRFFKADFTGLDSNGTLFATPVSHSHKNGRHLVCLWWLPRIFSVSSSPAHSIIISRCCIPGNVKVEWFCSRNSKGLRGAPIVWDHEFEFFVCRESLSRLVEDLSLTEVTCMTLVSTSPPICRCQRWHRSPPSHFFPSICFSFIKCAKAYRSSMNAAPSRTKTWSKSIEKSILLPAKRKWSKTSWSVRLRRQLLGFLLIIVAIWRIRWLCRMISACSTCFWPSLPTSCERVGSRRLITSIAFLKDSILELSRGMHMTNASVCSCPIAELFQKVHCHERRKPSLMPQSFGQSLSLPNKVRSVNTRFSSRA